MAKPSAAATTAITVAIAVIIVLVVVLVAVLVMRRENVTSGVSKAAISPGANLLDSQMMATAQANRTQLVKSGAFYPMIIVRAKGKEYYMKESLDSKEYSFSLQEGLDDLWNWGKGICHQIIWAQSLLDLVENDSSYDWKSDATKNSGYVGQTISELSAMLRYLRGINNEISVSSAYTSTAPVVLVENPTVFIDAARSILNKSRALCSSLGATTSVSDIRNLITSFVADVSTNASWLMYAVNDAVISRSVRTVLSWKKLLGEDKWKQVYFVVGIDTGDSSVVSYTPRGDCSSGNAAARVLKSVVTSDQFTNNLLMFDIYDQEITFDNAAIALASQRVASAAANGFNDSFFAKLLGEDLNTPENGLTAQFTSLTAGRVVGDCNIADLSSSDKCPFA
jgi:hypothetical protein